MGVEGRQARGREHGAAHDGARPPVHGHAVGALLDRRVLDRQLWDVGGPELMALGFEFGREREARQTRERGAGERERERQQVMSAHQDVAIHQAVWGMIKRTPI